MLDRTSKERTAPNEFSATDQCVMCGLCLPHCPTYAVTGNEADSPRGRISLIQALAQGRLPASPPLIAHLDGCLTCRACEDVCPSGVPYGRLIDSARAELRRRSIWRDMLMRSFVGLRPLRRSLYGALRLLGRCRFCLAALRRIPRGRRAIELAGRIPASDLKFGVQPADNRPEVLLFTGCAAEVFDRETLRAAQRLLDALGYRVVTPAAQTCCGALHRHAGDRATARKLARTNLAAFTANTAPILATSSACAVNLREYGLLLGAEGDAFGARVHEIGEFLASQPWPDSPALKPLPAKTAVHTPCTQRRVLHAPDAAATLLRHIPSLDIVELPGNERCCGAAGTHMLDHPQMADTLAAPKIRAAGELVPDFLATTNIGCAMHLARALAAAGQTVEVVHPLTLLARQLADPPSTA